MEKERRYNEDQERKKRERKERELQILKNYKQEILCSGAIPLLVSQD